MITKTQFKHPKIYVYDDLTFPHDDPDFVSLF